MSEVYAIKSKESIDKVEEFLLKHYGSTFSDIWRLGINLALRASDLLALTVEDIEHAKKSGYLTILEKKTSHKNGKRTTVKPRVIKLNRTALRIINERLMDHHNDTWLFQSIAKNHKKEKRNIAQPISYVSVFTAFKMAGEYIGVKMGTHTMRKTRGWFMHKDGVPIEVISKMFNHGDIQVTLRYIGIEQEQIDKTYDDYEL